MTPADARTLALLAETFVPACDGDRVAALASDALVRAADPAQVTQLRLVLRALEQPVANGLLGGPWRSFEAMDRPVRERVLQGWAASAIPQRRAAFGALRKLLTFLAYADPGTPEEPNRLLDAIGYEPDRPPITVDPTPIQPLDLPRATRSASALELEADVVVVGSGAGGGVIAAEVAAAGRSVIVLEAGPFVDEAAMPRNELDAYSRLYLNHGLLSTWDGAITLLSGSGVGGGTLVNWMTCIDVPDAVREEWGSEHGLDGLDAEWAADVAAIAAQIGVAAARVIPPKDQLILDGAASLGWQAGPIRRDAADCGVCGSCPFGCVTGAKQSGIRVHLRAAFGHGARIVDRVRVTRLLVDPTGAAVGVEGRLLATDPASGMPVLHDGDPTAAEVRRIVVHARQVVLAAGALRTPAILEASGLAHPAVGRYLRVHPVSVLAARMTRPVDMWRGTMQAAAVSAFVDGDAARRGYVVESAPGHPGLMALALPWSGAMDHADWMRRSRHLAPLIAITRDGGQGRVSLTRAGRVRIDYRLDKLGIATLRHGLVSMARLARAAGGAEELVALGTPDMRHRLGTGGGVGTDIDHQFERFIDALASFDFGPNRGSVFSAHQMGTARMGADPRTHATDPRGRLRRDASGRIVRGVYVADGSTFPTGIGVNPMLAIMAMARRVSRTVIAEAAQAS